MKAEKLKGHLDLLLLSVLSGGPGHGYEVITRLRDRSDGAFQLPEGTVYPALHRLESAGLLASTWEVVAGRRRRIYHLTLAGERAMAEQARQWREFSGSMARVLGAPAASARGAVLPGGLPLTTAVLRGTA
ncbi:MAG TPA: PadR family transcriptional regulator [Actinobacteria bacterium]|nr:PadR family transcriptional regulator [Actinomycetota bacterium]